MIFPVYIQVLDKLRRVERAHYGLGKNAQDELRKWRVSLKNLLMASSQPAFVSSDQIETLLRKSAEPSLKFKYDMYDINKLKECYRKIIEAVPDKFSEVITELKSILKYMEKYCLSFYDMDDENAVKYDTALDYEKKRRDIAKNVRERLKYVQGMVAKFRTDKFYLSDLSSYGLELSRKADCPHAPFLLIFPECCEHLRTCVTELDNWVEADGNYETFVKNDIADYEEKNLESLKIVREYQQKYHQLGFRHKQVDEYTIRIFQKYQ